MATLDDVAQLAGVSKSTASRALSRPELVAPATVARVRAAAEQLAFSPNRAATALAHGRSGLVAIVVPTLENSFFTPIIHGAQLRASESDMHLTIAVNGIETASDSEALRRLSKQVDGFLIAAPKGDDATVSAICALKPSVLIDREITKISSVVADTANAFGTLAGRLAEQGHTKIAFIGGPDQSWQNGQRTRAVRAALDGRASLTEFGPFSPTFSSGYRAVTDIVDSEVTAVVSYSSSISLGLMFGLRDRGIRVPDDIVVSADEVLTSALGMSESPSIDVDGERLGSIAMEQLVALLGDSNEVDCETRQRLNVPVRWS